MSPFRTVMVGLTLESAEEPAWLQACTLAARSRAKLIAFHVVRVPTMPEFGKDLEADAKRATEQIRALGADRLDDFASFEVETVIGDPADRVLDAVTRLGADVLVLSQRRTTPLGRFFEATVRSRILQECKRPVWIAHPAAADRAVERVLCAVDTSSPSGAALTTSAQVAREFGATLAVLQVFPDAAVRDSGSEVQDEALRTFASSFDLTGVDVEFVTCGGEPGGRIIDMVESRRSDLLVLGSAGRRGLDRWMRRNMTERVAWTLPCSMLSVAES